MGPITFAYTKKACLGQTLWLILAIHILLEKISVVNTVLNYKALNYMAAFNIKMNPYIQLHLSLLFTGKLGVYP